MYLVFTKSVFRIKWIYCIGKCIKRYFAQASVEPFTDPMPLREDVSGNIPRINRAFYRQSVSKHNTIEWSPHVGGDIRTAVYRRRPNFQCCLRIDYLPRCGAS